MGRELLLVIDTVANEKEVSRDMLFRAMEEALEVATSKLFSDDVNIRVDIDRKTGSSSGLSGCRLLSVVSAKRV